MTVTTTVNSISYAGNGFTTAFAFPYIFFEPSDLVVEVFVDATGVNIVPAPILNGLATYDYTVTGTIADGEYASGGTVTFNTAPPAAHTVSLVRAVPATQEVTLIDNTKFPAATINTEFDKLTVLAQQSSSVAHNALRIPDNETGLGTVAAPHDLRASKVLAWDASGNLVHSTKTLFEIETGTGGGGSATVPFVNLLDFGADPTGVADSLPAFVAAMGMFTYSNASQVARSGGLIFIPRGTYYVAGSINTFGKYGIGFEGEGPRSTVIKAGANTNYPIFVDIGSSAAGTSGVHITGLTLQGGGRGNANANGVEWDFAVSGKIENVNGGGCNKLFSISNGWQNELLDVYSDSQFEPKNNISLYCGPQGAGSVQNTVMVVNASFYNDVQYNVRCEFFDGSIWQSMQTGGAGTCCISLGNPSVAGSSGVHFFNADILMVDTVIGRGLEIIKGANATTMEDMTITNLWAGNTSFTGSSQAVYIEGGNRIQVVGGEIVTCSVGIELKNCTNCQVDTAIHRYNRDNTGAAACIVNGGSDNTIRVGTKPTSLSATIGYNGYVETGGTLRNQVFGFGEATWTPTLTAATPATGTTYATQSGTYSIDGRRVFYSSYVQLTSLGAGGAGALTITGLPFATDGGDYNFGHTGACVANNVAGLVSSVTLQHNTGVATISPQQQGATGAGGLTWANLTNSSVLVFQNSYLKV